MQWDRSGLASLGFEGFVRWADLTRGDLPAEGGVYVVLREAPATPKFLARSVGGHFKGKDPTVLPATLAAAWVGTSPVVYIGKATSLRARLWQYREFGLGKAIGHWGGRYIWQLPDSQSLVVAWRTTGVQEPSDVERELIANFVRDHGRRPFANLKA